VEKEEIAVLKRVLIENLTVELPVLRARCKISQGAIAEKIGISRQTYGMIENRKSEMSWTIFMALVAYFQSNDQTKRMLDQIPELQKLKLILK